MAYWFDESSATNAMGSSRQKDFYCDTDEDIVDLPRNSAPGKPMGDTVTHKEVDKGSTCLCIGSSSFYVLNSDDEWIKM